MNLWLLKSFYNIRLPPIPPPVQNLLVNSRLENAVYIAQNKLVGPETLAFSAKGELYAGLMNGDIVRVDLKTGSLTKIARIGQEVNDSKCSKTLYYIYKLNTEFRILILIQDDLSMGSKPECGRPMGIRFKKKTNILYVADAYNGIYKIDLDKGILVKIKNLNVLKN